MVTYADDFGTRWKQYIESFGDSYSSILFCIDQNVYINHYESILQFVSYQHWLMITPSSEEGKNLVTLERFWNICWSHLIDRKSLVVIIGGGVMLDMLSFGASVWKRGIDYCFIPTTLLAMVDAAIGGKTGINFNNGKNIIGNFSNPKSIFINTQFLGTLSERQIKNGYAEVLKHGLIADINHWEKCSKLKLTTVQKDEWMGIIQESNKIKQKIIEQDPKEQGIRKILNFGHTIGHALESYCLDNNFSLLHGEAVAWGILVEAQLSVKYCGLSIEDCNSITNAFMYQKMIVDLQGITPNKLLPYIYQDKKNINGNLLFSLISSIGSSIPNVDVSADSVLNTINLLIKNG